MARRNWQRREQMLALKLYMTTPFGRMHQTNPEIVALAKEIGRTPSAVALKMVNFVALDPTIDRRGMGNYSQSDAEIWQEFFASPQAFLTTLEAEPQDTTLYPTPEDVSAFSGWELREGEDRETVVKARRGQTFFRKMMIANYEGKCALTSIEQPELLVASHIAPWSSHKSARLNPNNGILLNSLHDRAFDNGLITFNDDFEMITSPKLKLDGEVKSFFERKRLRLPVRSLPDPAYLKHHRNEVFLN